MEKNAISIPASRKKAAFINIIRDYTSIIFLIVQGIVMVPLYLHYIDARLYGAWLATGSIVAFLGLFDFGFSSVIVQKTAETVGKGNYDALKGLVGAAFTLTAGFAILTFLTGVLLSLWVPGWVKIHGSDAAAIRIAFLTETLATSCMIMVYGIGGIFLGLQRVGVTTVIFITASFLAILCTYLLLKLSFGMLSIALGHLLQAGILLIGNGVFLWYLLKKLFPSGFFRLDRSTFQDVFRSSLWVFSSRLANVASIQSDNFIVAAVLDPRMVTIFSLTKKFSDIVTMLVTRVSSALMPGLAHVFGEGDVDKLKFFLPQILKVLLFAGSLGVGGIYLFNEEFVRLWVGREFYGGGLMNYLIGISCLVYMLNTAINSVIFAQGKIRVTSRAAILEASVRLPLSLVMCYYLGIMGLVFAGIIAVLPTSLIIQARCLLHILNLRWEQAVLSAFPCLLKASIPVVICLIFQSVYMPQGMTEIFAFGIFYVTFSVSFYMLFDIDLRRFFMKTLGFLTRVRLPRSIGKL